MVEKKLILGVISVIGNGVIQVRIDTVIEEDGVEISRNFHRHVVEVGDNVDNEFEMVRQIANAIWTPEIREKRRIELIASLESIKL